MKQTKIGYVLLSQRIADEMTKSRQFSEFIGDSIGRQLRCDWGDKKEINDKAYAKQHRISAMYKSPGGQQIMIITEVDKNLMPRTSVVFPEEGGFNCL